MAMVVNNNIPALSTYNVINSTSNSLSNSIKKLSTGLRINSAADDAAGLAISEKMRAQINGLDQAVSNSQDGISLIQTAEGALNETHSILQRMRELSVQAANDTLTQQDRSYIQEEVDQLREEITRIGNTTQFNKKKLLNGDAAVLWSSSDNTTKAIVNGGLRTIDQFGQKSSAEGNYKIEIDATAGKGEVQKTDIFKIKHALASSEWEDNDTFDGTVVKAGTIEGLDGLAEGDTVTVSIKEKLDAAKDATMTLITGQDDPGLTWEKSTTAVDVNGIVKITVKNGAITGEVWGNGKDGTEVKGDTFSVSASDLGTGKDDVTTAGGYVVGKFTGNNLTDGEYYYTLTATGDETVTDTNTAGDSVATPDVVVNVTKKLNGQTYSQDFVMSQSAFDGAGSVNLNSHTVYYDTTEKAMANVDEDKDPEIARIALTKEGTLDITAVNLSAATNTVAGISKATATGYDSLSDGDKVTIVGASSTEAPTAGSVTNKGSDDITSGITTAQTAGDFTGRVTITAAANGSSSNHIDLSAAKFTGIGKDGVAYNDVTVTLSKSADINNEDVTLSYDGKTIATLTFGTDQGSNANGKTYVFDVVAAKGANDVALKVSDGTNDSVVVLNQDKITTGDLSFNVPVMDDDTYAGANTSRQITLTLTKAATPALLNATSGTAMSDPVVAADPAVVFTAAQGVPTGTLATFTWEEGDPDESTIGERGSSDTNLRDLDKFWDSEGNFLLSSPQTLTLTQGDGKQATITLYEYDTLGTMATKINDAIAKDLGQADYLATKDADGKTISDDDLKTAANSFATFVDKDDVKDETSEAVQGTMVIRSIAPGAAGSISFSGDEALINALSLNTIQSSKENQYTVNITDAHTGKEIVTDAKITGNKLVGALHENIDVEFDAMAGISAVWDDKEKKFTYVDSTSATPADTYETYLHLSDNTTVFQIGANQGEDMGINIGDMRAHALGLDEVNVMSRDTASRSITIIDNAIDKVSTQRAKLGAYQNRLEHTINNLTVASENLTSAESRIRDTDMAKEMMNFTKLQIMLQAGNSMLAQANQLPQNVLSLVR